MWDSHLFIYSTWKPIPAAHVSFDTLREGTYTVEVILTALGTGGLLGGRGYETAGAA